MNKRGIFSLLLILICVLAVFFRTYHLSQIPQGFHTDEIVAGYVGHKIIQTGKDTNGNMLPLYFNTFGDFRPTGIFYLAGISTSLLGLSEFAVRLPAAVFGVLSVMGMYFLAKEVYKSKLVGVLSCLLLTILPWHIVLSRATSEGVIGLCFCIWGLYFLFRLERTQKKMYLFFASILLFISMFFYHPFRIISPLIFLPFIFAKNSKKGTRRALSLVFVIFLAVLLFIATQRWGSSRFSQVAFYNNPSFNSTYEGFYSDEKTAPTYIIRFFHNKFVIVSRDLLRQVFSHTSPEYLFMHGGLPDRYAIPEQGLLYFFFLPFLFLAIIHTKEQKKQFLFLFYLFLIGLIPTILTYEDTPNIHRSIFLIVPIVLMTGFGMDHFFAWSKKQKSFIKYGLLLGLFFIGTFEVLYFWHQYTVHAVKRKVFARVDGNKELAKYLGKEASKFDSVFLTYNDQMPIYYLFFNNITQQHLQAFGEQSEIASRVNNVYFVKDWCGTKVVERRHFPKNKKYLIINGGSCLPATSFYEIKKIERSDGTLAFTIYKN